MEALRAEIARKKAGMMAPPPEGGTRRWVKTADLTARREAEREREAESRLKPGTKRRKVASSEAAPEVDATVADVVPVEEQKQQEQEALSVERRRALLARREALAALSSKQLFARLRSTGEPVTLFGEQPEDRLERLAALELSENSGGRRQDEGFGLAADYAMANTFLGNQQDQDDDAQDEEEEESDEDEDDSNVENGETKDASSKSDHQKMKKASGASHEYRYIRKWITARLKEWERDLADRPEVVKKTPQGRVATKTYKQCKDYIRPLIKLCKHKNLDDGMRGSLMHMCEFCTAGEFVKANDVYIGVAIGNAAWPIGVTSTGVHQRGVNCDESKIAHIMNNEMQRKFLTSVKRLMRIAQDQRPDVPPSKKVM